MATPASTLRLAAFPSRPTCFARISRQLQYAAAKRWMAGRPIGGRCRRTHKNTGQQTRSAATSPTTATGSKPTSSPNSTIVHTDHPLQSYQPPDTGVLSTLPRSWVPYAELMRLDKPAGTYYLFLPCVFSTLLAAPLATPIAPISSVAGTVGLFAVGAFIMRGAGCTVNDLWDRNLDPHVTRTRLRPIARGAVSVKQAVPFLGGQLLAGLTLLLQLPWECFFYATPSLLFVATYPLAKRVTNYPQFVLGLTFSWGAIMGFPALGIDLLSNTPAMISAACLYGSCVAWTMVYDMIYAYQDIRDDVKAGIKSIALAQEHNAKVFLTSVSALQVGLLAGAGAAIGAGPVFYAGVCGGAAGTLGYMIKTVNLQSVDDCWRWFRKGAWFTGGAISFGLAAEYMAQYLQWYEGFERASESKAS
ncbi:hypothetical protein D0869_07927 [Hortaea werneckii]|uniref:4-hydroxybenzoate polyprenyltransferase, mitochondrial n=1 Tax=Hortaea werneckii TaxID=91943 RepID=A0A3M6ZHB3_HORWE|nr:hypothetical protein D0869_07927 [Hortaea werneckii]RMY14489.1 hypothetical protein D0868_01424 [Hortaea werneckii]RMY19516.1 hypothetical protein D0867_04624 [Hortaea werneckii]